MDEVAEADGSAWLMATATLAEIAAHDPELTLDGDLLGRVTVPDFDQQAVTGDWIADAIRG